MWNESHIKHSYGFIHGHKRYTIYSSYQMNTISMKYNLTHKINRKEE